MVFDSCTKNTLVIVCTDFFLIVIGNALAKECSDVIRFYRKDCRLDDLIMIPNTVKVGESIYYSLLVVQYSPKASAGVAYRRFAKELISYGG